MGQWQQFEGDKRAEDSLGEPREILCDKQNNSKIDVDTSDEKQREQ